MKRLALAVTMIAGVSAFATDYTWTGGGAAGVWNDPLNWGLESGATCPNATDTVFFNEDVTITQDIELAEGTLTITNAASTKLTFDCVISGEGGVSKGGKGDLYLMKANPFKGKFENCGTDRCNWEDRSKPFSYSSKVFIYDAGAMGVNEAIFDKGGSWSSQLNLCAPANVVFDIPITLPGHGSQQGDGLKFYPDANGGSQTVTFKKQVNVNLRFRETRDRSNLPCYIHFDGGITAGYFMNSTSTSTYYFDGGTISLNIANVISGPMYFNVPFTLSNANLSSGARDVHLNASGNKMSIWDMSGKNRIWCGAENCIGISGTQVTFRFNGDDAWIDLGGYDQSVPSFGTMVLPAGKHNVGFTSPADRPAQLKLTEWSPANQVFTGQFAGSAGLEWGHARPAESHVFDFQEVLQPTIGDVTVKDHVVRMSNGGGFASLGKLQVRAAGRFEVAADAGSFLAERIELASDGTSFAKLDLAEGKTLRCTKLFINGEEQTEKAEYTATDLPDYIVGAGKVVTGVPVPTIFMAETGDWNDGACWSRRVPAAGDTVTIQNGSTVSLTNSTPELLDLTVQMGATLSLSNFTTKVSAQTVAVHGTVTTFGAFQTETNAPAARVWIACSDFTLGETGKIDVKGKGWAGSTSRTTPGIWGEAGNGFGPGATSCRYAGASHGGLGAVTSVSDGFDNKTNPNRLHSGFGYTYDDPFAPLLPGSGTMVNTSGAFAAADCGNDGGGAVLIEATGSVTIDGTIDADAADKRSNTMPLGSGGAVWIKSSTFCGSGVVTANGGSSLYGCYPAFLAYYQGEKTSAGGAMAGGGGMIRIEYETLGSVAGMKVSAACGYALGDANGSKLTAVNHDKWRVEADLGTLTFSDAAIVAALLGKGLSGRLVGLSDFTYDGDLDWTWGHVRFSGEGASVTFDGNLRVSGPDSRCEIGGITSTVYRTQLPDRYAGTVLNACRVKGDLVLDGGAFDIRAAETNATMAWGGELKVDGSLTVKDRGYLYPWCDVANLGASRILVDGDFTVEAGGTVCADRRGGAAGRCSGGYSWNATFQAYVGDGLSGYFRGGRLDGYGLGANLGNGATHGGLGGKCATMTNDVAWAYHRHSVCEPLNDEWTAAYPGAGGGSGGYGPGGEGGGLVYVEAKGAITVDGTISANGATSVYAEPGSATSQYGVFGAGAGGGIHLYGKTIAGTGRLSAKGGDETCKTYARADADPITRAAGCGGGGRIVLATGADLGLSGAKVKTLRSVDTPFEDCTFAGDLIVSGGVNCWANADSANVGKTAPQITLSHGGDGTVRYLRSIPAPGLLLFVR